MHAANGVDLDAPGGELCSLLLRATYTAEHEAGVDELQRDLGCDADRGSGLAARLAGPAAAEACSLVTGHAEERFWVETPVRGRPGRTRIRALTQTTEYCALSLGRDHRHRDPDRLRARVAEIGRRYRPEDPVAGAWDWANCLIVGYGPGQAHVAALHAALQAGDLALWIGRPSDAPHHRAGLILARASRLNPTVGEALARADRAAAELRAAADATGIRARIEDATGRRGAPWHSPFAYLALAPAWLPEGVVSAHRVRFWLTPLDPRVRPGWYTVESLDAWLAGDLPGRAEEEGGAEG